MSIPPIVSPGTTFQRLALPNSAGVAGNALRVSAVSGVLASLEWFTPVDSTNPDWNPTGNLFTIGTTANSQRIRLRRHFVSAGDFSQLSIGWSGDNCQIQTQQTGNNPNPLILGTNGFDRLFLSGTTSQLGLGAAATTRQLELHDARPSVRFQVTSATAPPTYAETSRAFDINTWQDTNSPFNTFTDLVANSNQFNAHAIRVYVHANGTSAPIFSTMFYQTGRVGIGSETDNNLGRLQIVQDNITSQALSHLTFRGNWNTTGAPTAFDINQTDTASDAASLLVNLRTNGVSRFSVRKDGLLSNAGSISCQGSISCNGTFTLFDTILVRSAQHEISQRNGTNPQRFQIENTWTSTTNRETGYIRWVTDVFRVGTEKGTVGGNPRALILETDGTPRLEVGATDWQVRIGNLGNNAPSIFTFTSSAITSPVSGRGICIFGRNNIAGSTNIALSGDAFSAVSGANTHLIVGGGFAPTSGTGTFFTMRVSPTINQTGGANGITRGIAVEPTLTSASDWRSFDTIVNSGFAYHSSGTAPSRLGGSLTWVPDASVVLSSNLQFAIERVSDTVANLVYRGSDGNTRRWKVPFGVYTLPEVDGTLNQVLTTDGLGTVTWSNGGASSAFVIAMATAL